MLFKPAAPTNPASQATDPTNRASQPVAPTIAPQMLPLDEAVGSKEWAKRQVRERAERVSTLQAQLAESRTALDGQAYTWPEFVEAYGGDAPRCWNDALQGSIPRRIALDGQAYTWTQYVEAYGEDARRCRNDAYDRVVAAQVFDHRDASQLAVNAHGEAQPAAAISVGGPHDADAEPQPAAAINEETPREHDAYNRDASQLAVNAHGEAQPAAAIGDGGPREADAEPRPAAAIDEETPHEEPIQHEQNDSDASQLAGTTSIEEFDLVSSIARYYEATMEYEVDVWDHD